MIPTVRGFLLGAVTALAAVLLFHDADGGPPGGFLIPCQEDEYPRIIPDPASILPPGVWYECAHPDETSPDVGD